MIDKDLANLYGVKTKVLNQAVKRNSDRFRDYVFLLTDGEKRELVTKCDRFKTLKHATVNPYAFTEHGTLMISSVIGSEFAIEINRKIIQVFVELRNQISLNTDIPLLREKILKLEASVDEIKTGLKLEGKLVSDKVTHLSRKVLNMSQILDEFQDSHLIIKRPDQELTG